MSTDMAAPLLLLLLLCVLGLLCVSVCDQSVPPYIKQCRLSDPNKLDCFIAALHHVRPFLAHGIPEIEMPSVEPFRMDQLSLSLTSGPGGYRVVLRDIDIYGASNYSVAGLRLSDGKSPFEGRIRIPELTINARYTSSGVLIILPASGNGTFHAHLGDITATVRGMTSNPVRDGHVYLHVDSLSMDLAMRTVRMGVKDVGTRSRVLAEATNLFLRDNGHEVVAAMYPQLTAKLSAVFRRIANQLLQHVSTDTFLLP